MSKFSGPQFKGAARMHREAKRAEAEARNKAAAGKRTKAHRLGTVYDAALGMRRIAA